MSWYNTNRYLCRVCGEYKTFNYERKRSALNYVRARRIDSNSMKEFVMTCDECERKLRGERYERTKMVLRD